MNKILSKEVSFELAKLLFEKNYDENTKFGYNGVYEPHHLNLIEFGSLQRNSELIKGVYSAPTIAEVIDWIFDKYRISIYYNYDHFSRKFIPRAFTTLKHNEISLNSVKSPLQAYEEAIKYILENLVK